MRYIKIYRHVTVGLTVTAYRQKSYRREVAVMPLTDTAIRNAKPADKPQKLADGGGLYLLLNPTGSRWWRFDYRFDGKRKTLSMGTYPDTGLKDARDTWSSRSTTLASSAGVGMVKRASFM